jgi:hypothetical protein
MGGESHEDENEPDSAEVEESSASAEVSAKLEKDTGLLGGPGGGGAFAAGSGPDEGGPGPGGA